MFMSCHFPLQPRHVDGVLYVDFYGISTVNIDHPKDLLGHVTLQVVEHLAILGHPGLVVRLVFSTLLRRKMRSRRRCRRVDEAEETCAL